MNLPFFASVQFHTTLQSLERSQFGRRSWCSCSNQERSSSPLVWERRGLHSPQLCCGWQSRHRRHSWHERRENGGKMPGARLRVLESDLRDPCIGSAIAADRFGVWRRSGRPCRVAFGRRRVVPSVAMASVGVRVCFDKRARVIRVRMRGRPMRVPVDRGRVGETRSSRGRHHPAGHQDDQC